MPTECDISLQDLVKIAFGSSHLSNVNIAILQSLMGILLKKLNCENETVSLNVYESKHLENILKTAKICPMVFNDENIENISEKLERLNKLEECVQGMDEKLDMHLQEMQRKSNFSETALNWENWPSYGCEHLCTACDANNEIACSLLKNTDFIKKLLRRMSAPIVERIFYFEEKLEKLNVEFTKFIKRAEEEYLKIQLIEKSITEIEQLRQITQEQQTQFLATMEEIQDMLDTKLDKIHVPALKKYIRDKFQHIDQSIKTLQQQQKYSRAAGIIMDGVRCVCCGNSKVCSNVSVQPTAVPDMPVKSKKLRKYCGHALNCCRSQTIAASSWNLGDFVKYKRSPAMKRVSALPTCRKAGEDFELLEGYDGKLYRKG